MLRAIKKPELKRAHRAITTEGYCVIEGYAPTVLCEEWRAQIEERYSARLASGLSSAPPVGLQKTIGEDATISNIIAYERGLLDVATTGDHLQVLIPLLNDPSYKLIPDSEPNFILSQANARRGDSAIPFHVDVRKIAPNGETWSYQAQLALSPRMSNTGGLRVRPRTHLQNGFPSSIQDYSDAIDIELATGDLIIFSSQLHHATHAPTKIEEAGWAFNLTYRCWWVKPQFDFWRMLDNTLLRELTQSQQVLLGGASQIPTDPDASPSMRTGYLSKSYFDQ